MAEQERIMSLEELEANERESVRKMIEELPKKSIFSRVFINRPRFAVVIALVMSIVGVIAIRALPIAQYPEVTPPAVRVSCTYPGANAVDLANSVAIPIESAVNGVEDMLYMSSSCTDSGRYSLTVTFAVGTDRDIAQVRVQNRVAHLLPLPQRRAQQARDLRLPLLQRPRRHPARPRRGRRRRPRRAHGHAHLARPRAPRRPGP